MNGPVRNSSTSRQREFVFDEPPAGVTSSLQKVAVATGAFSAQPAVRVEGVVRLRRQQPPMLALDELVLLLHTAAEIEHSLMVQYLYAAYSLPDQAPHSMWAEILAGIAREEMGHLMAIQNILLAMSAPLNFEREDYPMNVFYPFPLQLESVSVSSIARYVLAEMPDPAEIPGDLGFDLSSVRADAGTDAAVNRVGALYVAISELAREIGQETLNTDSNALQAAPNEWFASVHNLVMSKVLRVDDVASLTDQIARQGEGLTEPHSGPPSHFVRLFKIYRETKQHLSTSGDKYLGLAVPHNPSVRHATTDGYLQHEQTRHTGGLFNTRYRWLLFTISHYLGTDNPNQRTELNRWAIEDMHALRKLAILLSQSPQHDPIQFDADGRPLAAGAPFELPYSLALPTRQLDRWRQQALIATQHEAELLQAADSTGPLAELLDQTKTRRARILTILETTA